MYDHIFSQLRVSIVLTYLLDIAKVEERLSLMGQEIANKRLLAIFICGEWTKKVARDQGRLGFF